ncbi:MAG: hypothetical protein A2V99_18020 [Spirochaetes bacterium RBG_16_67_19]|nr:MAG: hypothetical protein A2V99_18020 [Spirochaetes bacterium RBG_16_67_19]
MRKLWMLILFPLLLSCRPLPSLLVLLDPYTAELLAAEGLDAAALRRELRAAFRVRVQVVDPLAEAAVEAERLARASGAGWVFLAPLLPLDAEALAASLPEVRFLREQPLSPRAPNLRRLRFQREEAWRAAGTIAARMLTQPSLLGGDQARGAPKAGLLQAVPTLQGSLEADAFRQGFLSEAGPELLVERTIGSLTDTGQARRLLERMQEEGVAVFMLKTYALSGFCLEFLRAEGGMAILEDGAGRGAFPDQVALWLEEDLAGALRNLGSTPDGEPVLGPVRLRSGAVLRSSPARAELGFPEMFE